MHIAGHQTRPLIFSISLEAEYQLHFSVEVIYQTANGSLRAAYFDINLEQRPLSDPLRITYLHPAGIVSYAILRAPPLSSCNISQRAPVILALHGAGLEADSVEARGMLDAAYGICAWMLFPSGVTSWSGDDWRESMFFLLFANNSVTKKEVRLRLLGRRRQPGCSVGHCRLDQANIVGRPRGYFR